VGLRQQELGAIDQVGAGKFAEQLIDVADRLGLLLHAEHGGGHQEVRIVQKVGSGAAFDESSQHDRGCFRLFRVDEPFGLV
jgi:hypothetical protein